jgi:hypothetical protein
LLPASPERMPQVQRQHQVVVPSVPTLVQSFVC